MNSILDASRSGERLEQRTPARHLRLATEFIVVAICILAFLMSASGLCASLFANGAAGQSDFVTYWASAHLALQRANPYDEHATADLERSAGFPSDEQTLIMRNPPTALLLVLPLGFVGPRSALLLWTLASLISLVISVRMVWIMHGRPETPLTLLGYTFGPAMVCLLVGQMSIFVLLGLTLFLRFHRSRPFYAGVSLWLCLLKPHLLLPFGVALLTWAIVTRNYKIVTGLAVALGISFAIALALDPPVWFHYQQMMAIQRADRVPIPCLSVALRRTLSPEATWLQFLPVLSGILWALMYYRRHRGDWDWITHGSPLVLLSVMVAPYVWLVDHAIVVPALLHAVYLTRSRAVIGLLALASAAIQVGIFKGGTQMLHSTLYLWAAPAWCIWYVFATRLANDSKPILAMRGATP